MLMIEPLDEVVGYFKAVKKELELISSPSDLQITNKALHWLSLCLSALIVTGVLCWEKFERSSGGRIKAKALSWMLHHSKRFIWERLLLSSGRVLMKIFDIKEVHLCCDDTDRQRSKGTKNIFGVHKVINKNGGGFISAQNIVFLVIVARNITFPVSFAFYRPDPFFKEWIDNDKKLRKGNVSKKNRPKKPLKNPEYPTKREIFSDLVKKFKTNFSAVEVRSISADAAFLSRKTDEEISALFPKSQYISQYRSNQKIMCGRLEMTLNEYFSHITPTKMLVTLRGNIMKTIWVVREKLWIKAMGKERLVIAFKYDGEEEYRYLSVSDPTWLTSQIIQAYSFRWLIEVAIEDWKQYEGWGKGASQQGVDGACRSLSLSLLLDHALLHHPQQQSLCRAGQPLVTVGSLRTKLQFESIMKSFEKILQAPNPRGEFQKLSDSLKDVIPLRQSRKHMNAMQFEKFGRAA